MIIILENKNPTSIEKAFWKYFGLYVVERYNSYDCDYIKYAECHPEVMNPELSFEKFPEEFEIDTSDILYDKMLSFESFTESVEIHNTLADVYMMHWIIERARELGWNVPEKCEVDNNGIIKKKE